MLCLIVAKQGIAQDPQLLDNEWYLQKVIINENETSLPDNIAYGFLSFQNETIEVSHPNCGEGFSNDIMYISDDSFTIDGGGSVLLGDCTEPEQNELVSDHFSIYYQEDNETPNNPFLYVFNNEDQFLFLTVTNNKGNQAIYVNELLGISENDFTNLQLYPNPAGNEITIVNEEFLSISIIDVYDISGKKILSSKNQSTENFVLNVSTIKTGVYFLTITLNSGEKTVRKFIKK